MRGVTKLAPGRGHVELAERDEPRARPGHVVLDVVARRDLRHRPAHRGRRVCVRPPVTMGHEVSGVVAELGEGVDGSGAVRAS